jgi:hypothetical protein
MLDRGEGALDFGEQEFGFRGRCRG